MDNNIVLSICIPTLNRVNYLLENLSILMPQISDNSEIEVLINNNGSIDCTKEIIETSCKKYHWKINVKNLTKTIPSHENYDDIINRSSGTYIYLLGDDDIISSDFIKVVLPILKTYKYSIIHFNRLSGDHRCSNNKLHDQQFISLRESLHFEDFVLRVMSSPNFISSHIFKRDIWNKGKQYYLADRYFGYTHFARIYFGAIGTDCLYYYLPLVIMRNPNRPWAKYGFIYTMIGMSNIFNDLDKEIPGVKKVWMHRIRKTHYYDFYILLDYLAKDPSLHKKYRLDILNLCISSNERSLVNFLLNHPLFGFTSKLYIKLLKMYRLFSRQYYLTRIVDF